MYQIFYFHEILLLYYFVLYFKFDDEFSKNIYFELLVGLMKSMVSCRTHKCIPVGFILNYVIVFEELNLEKFLENSWN